MKNIRPFVFPGIAIIILLIAPFSASLTGNSDHRDADAFSNPSPRFDSVHIPQQQYIWPTDASRRVTSSFAEYRTTHFHGGIDISTNGVKGYNVVAVRDGYVYKVRITPNGYGKMLFIKHDDGYISVYAHLEGFNDEITKVVRAEQYRRGTYAIDLLFDKSAVPVKQGDVVAYSGDSGFGPPHLHFEIRDENLNPVNPMLFKSYKVVDDIPPFIRRVMIAPLTYNSTIDNNTQPKFLSRFPRQKHLLSIPQTFRLHGRIGFAVDAEDRSDGMWNNTGIHRMEMFIDDSLAFAMELDHVPADETKQIDLAYDYPAIAHGHGKFQKLYVDTGNELPFYFGKPAGTGVINTEQLSEGTHAYRILCYDINGNHVELHGSFLANHKPELVIHHVDNENIIVGGTDLSSIVKCYVYGKRAFQSTWTQHTLVNNKFELNGSEITLPVAATPYDVVKIIAETKWGSQSSPLFYFVKKPLGPARDVHIDNEIFNDHVKFTVTTPGVFTETPLLSVKEGNTSHPVLLEAIDVNKYTGSYMPSNFNMEDCPVEVTAEVNGKPASAHSEIPMCIIPATKAGNFSINNNLIISYDSGAVYQPLCLQINSENEHRTTVYTLEPDDVLLDGGITVSLPVPQDIEQHKYGLYFRGNAGWVFQTARPDSNRKTFSTTLRRMLGEVAVLSDDAPPTFGRARITTRRSRLYVSFRYFDNLSGVDPDEIKMYLDGTLVIPEIDGEHRLVSYQGEESLNKGKHLLRIVMKDRAGNAGELSRSLTVR